MLLETTRGSRSGMDPLERRSFLWSSVGLGMLVVISLIGAWTLKLVNQSDNWVDHTREVISFNERLLSDVKDAESGERGYIITGDEGYLAPYSSSSQDIPQTLSKLQQLTSDNPQQKARLNTLGDLIAKRIAVFNHALNARKTSGMQAAQDIVVEGQGLHVMEEIRDLSQQIEAEELRLLQERSQIRQRRLRNGFIAVLGATILALLALLSAPFDVRRAVRQRNLAENAKKESESTAHALFQAATQGIVIADQSGKIVMANPATERLLGYSNNELIGQSIELLVPAALRGGHVQHRQHFFANPQNRPMGLGLDLWARRKDGSEFPAEISLSYIPSQRGTLAVAFVTDISKRKADEQEIRHQREDLRKLAARLMSAQDDERRRIARDLHDDLSQKLAYLSMDIGKLATKPSAGALVSDLRPLQLRAAEAAETVRRISHQLHPSILDDIGLEAAIEQSCEEFEERSGITTHFSARNVPDNLSREVAGSIYHICQECLRNVAKHSQAETVFVTLEAEDNVLRLTVKDEGIGITGDRPGGAKSIGIVGMKERAHLINGKLSIQSQSGEGTEVNVEVPLAD